MDLGAGASSEAYERFATASGMLQHVRCDSGEGAIYEGVEEVRAATFGAALSKSAMLNLVHRDGVANSPNVTSSVSIDELSKIMETITALVQLKNQVIPLLQQ